jgi:hypothetical protein
MLKAFAVSAVVFAFGVAPACTVSDDSPNGPAGSERGPCYKNKTCDSGLTCLSDVCVATTGAGGEAGSPGTSEAGSSGKGTTAGSSAGGSGGTGQANGGETLGGASSGGEANGVGGQGDGGAGGAPDLGPATAGGLRLNWSLKGASTNNALSCADAGGSTVSVILTKLGSPSVEQEDLFDCGQGGGDTFYDFGDYTVAIQLVNGAGLALGSAPSFTITVDATPCTAVVDGHCLKAKTVVIDVDGS